MQILGDKVITTDEILKIFGPSLDEKSLKNILTGMMNDGFVYSSGPGYRVLD